MPTSVHCCILLNETLPLLLLRVYMCVFLACCLLQDANQGFAPSLSERAGSEWLVWFPSPARQCRAFFSNECGFSRGRVPFQAEFVFPLHTYYILRRMLQKPRKQARAGRLSLCIAELLALNPCDSKHRDPVPLRRFAFDSCCQQ